MIEIIPNTTGFVTEKLLETTSGVLTWTECDQYDKREEILRKLDFDVRWLSVYQTHDGLPHVRIFEADITIEDDPWTCYVVTLTPQIRKMAFRERDRRPVGLFLVRDNVVLELKKSGNDDVLLNAIIRSLNQRDERQDENGEKNGERRKIINKVRDYFQVCS